MAARVSRPGRESCEPRKLSSSGPASGPPSSQTWQQTDVRESIVLACAGAGSSVKMGIVAADEDPFSSDEKTGGAARGGLIVGPIRLGWCVVPAICAAIGCTGARAAGSHEPARREIVGSRSVPTGASDLMVPHPPEGPPCGPGGPTLELKEMQYHGGKPPHRSAIVDVRVRNPLASPVWLLYDVGDGLPSVINAVTLSRTSPVPGTHVWSFAGDDAFKALRLPPQADLVLREIEVDSYSTRDPFVLVFATSMTISNRPVESWAGDAGLSPASGDFTLTETVKKLERTVDDWAAKPLAVHILCVKRFDADDPANK